MANTRDILAKVESHLLESLGNRAANTLPNLAPTPHVKDIGRRPVEGFGAVDIDQVIPDPNQPRKEFAPDALHCLADSVHQHGQLAPIRVRWSDTLLKWVITAGERRWRAAQLAGLSTIECYFDSHELSPSEVLEQQLIENLLREDLKPVEEAKAYASLMQLNEWTGKQVAERLHVPASQVSRALALLRLPEDIQHRIDAGQIPARAAYELSKLEDVSQQRQLADRAATGHLTHEKAASAVRQRRGKSRHSPRSTKLTFPTEHGWKIIVSSPRKGTYDEIEQALMEVLAEVRHRIQNNVQLF